MFRPFLVFSVLLLTLVSLVTAHEDRDDHAFSPVQFCRVNTTASIKTDLCFAVASWKNQTSGKKDVSLHFSVRFEGRNGWAAFGVGDHMKGALMFVMYPGDGEGEVTMSIRSAPGHYPPNVTPNAPDIHVTKTWVDPDGLHNAQIVCYDCESWKGSELDVDDSKQSWVWSSDWEQETRSDDPELGLKMHKDWGVAKLNMESSYHKHADEPVIAIVSEPRITISKMKKHHKHKTFGLVSIHGFILGISFVSLSGGILAIRSGITNSFRTHWVIQTVAGGLIVVGCLMGIWLSISHGGHFGSFHQITGLTIFPGIIAQGVLGYWHHINFVKLGRRTAVSNYHVWIGRSVLAIGNINVGLGLKLSHASWFKFFVWLATLAIQLGVLVPMWYYWNRGRSVMNVVEGNDPSKQTTEYVSVEQDPFILEDDDFDDDEGMTKGRDLEMK